MVDHIVAAARNVTLKADKLIEQPVVLGQRDAATVEHRKRVTIEVGLDLLARLVTDAALQKRLGRKTSAPPVPTTLEMRYDLSSGMNSSMTCDGMNGGVRSRTRSITTPLPSR